MAPIVKRPVPKTAGGAVNLGDPATYFGGGQFDLPPGRYALECTVQLFTPKKASEFLAVMVNFHPLEGGEAIPKPLGMGQKAHLGFSPSEDGLGVDPIPGGKGSITSLSNWGIFRQSLIDCGLPPEHLQNDVSVLNGLWIVTDNTENEERKKLKDKPKVGEAAGDPDAQRSNYDNKQVVCVEILEEGRVWEGGGGFEFPAAPTTKTPAKVTKMTPPGAKKPVVAAPVEEEEVEETTEEEGGVEMVTLQGVTNFLAKPGNEHGCTKLALRSAAFGHVKKTLGDDAAQEAGATYFGPGKDAALKKLLAPLGYTIVGLEIKPST